MRQEKQCITHLTFISSHSVIVWVRVVLKRTVDDHTIRTTDTPGFKPFTILHLFGYITKKKGKVKSAYKLSGPSGRSFSRFP